MSPDDILAAARRHLKVALKMLGDRGPETVLDASLAGAGVLARDASDLLEELWRERTGTETGLAGAPGSR